MDRNGRGVVMLDEREAKGEPVSEAAGESAEAIEATDDAEQAEAGAGDATSEDAAAVQQRLLDENEELKRQLAESQRSIAGERERATPPTDPAPSQERAFLAEMERLELEAHVLDRDLALLADQNDPLALAVRNMKQQQRMVNQLSLRAARDAADKAQVAQDESYIARMDDPKDRAAFKAWLTPARKAKFAGIEEAHEAFDGHQYRQQKASLAQKRKAADEVVSARDRGVVATGSREVSAKESKARGGGKLSGAAFDARYDKLMAAGDIEGAVALSRQASEIIED